MKKPNFFIIGGLKCGTTYLAHHLSRHPQVFMSKEKELWFFCTDLVPRARYRTQRFDIQWFESFFENATGHHKVVGEASVSYLYSSAAVKNILGYNHESKFLVALRNPLEVAVSAHAQEVINGQESVADFWKAWQLQETRRKGRKIPLKCTLPEALFYKDWCLWGRQIDRLLKLVGRDKVHIMIFDDFLSDPDKEFSAILDFLEIDNFRLSSYAPLNERKRPRNLSILNFIDLLRNRVGPVVANRMEDQRSTGIYRSLRSMNRAIGKLRNSLILSQNTKRVDFERNKELAEVFREDVESLSELLGRDMTYWIRLDDG